MFPVQRILFFLIFKNLSQSFGSYSKKTIPKSKEISNFNILLFRIIFFTYQNFYEFYIRLSPSGSSVNFP